MGKTQNLGHLAHIVAYDGTNHITVPAGITMHTNQLVASQAYVDAALASYALISSLGSYVPTSRTITINGTTLDLSANRSFTIAAGLTSFNTRTGAVTLTSGDVTTALGYTPYSSTNPSGYITGYTETDTLASVTGRGATTNSAVIINNNLAVNTSSPYATSTYSLDINGALLVKNTGRAANITLINANPAGGGNNAFVIHTVSGTAGNSLVDIQGYYGANVTGSTTIRLNPLGGNVTINGYTVYHTNNLPSIPTNTNQLTNGAGYITSSGNISGYAMSLNGYSQNIIYTILDGPANGPVIKVRYDGGTANRYIDIGSKDGNGVYSEGLKLYNGSTMTWLGSTVWTAGNLTNLNQLSNGPGYITGISFANVSAKPTTLSGYGITDAVPSSRTITINGTALDLSDNRSFTVSGSDATKLPLSGGTLSGNLLFSDSGTTKRGIQGTVGTNDMWFVGGNATGSNAGFLEISTGDDGQTAGAAEPIFVRQYGPGDPLTGTLFRSASLLDANGNTSFPGNLTIGNSAEVMGLIQMGASGRYGMGISSAYTNVYGHNSGNGVRLGYYDGTTFYPRMTIPNGGAPLIDSNVIIHAGNIGSQSVSSASYSNSVYIGGSSSKLIGDNVWAGGGGYPGYSFTGGNSRFGFSSTGGVIDVYADGNFYATDSSHLVWHAGNLTNLNQLSNGPGYLTSVGIGNMTDIHRLFNNMGNNHGTYQDFNSVGNFGVRYMQGSTNGPQSGQFYGFTLGLGNDYSIGQYGSQFYWMRNTSTPYIWTRYLEGGSWGGWNKISAGYADSAGSASSATYANSAGAVSWGNVSSKPSHIMYYQSFTLDANTMDSNSTGFTYANNAPFYGPIARFSTGGGYDLWLGGSYNGGGNSFHLRTRNGDAGSLNSWREIITSGNIASQKVDGSFKFWATSHPNDYYLVNNWTGTYWRITSNHSSGVQVAYADSAGSAPAAGGTATALNSSNYINRCGSSGNANTDFQNTPAGSVRHNGDDAGLAGSPGGSWWFYDNYRHSNGSNYWGTQVAWGWEDNANRLATRNISANSFGGWVYYMNTAAYPYAANMNQYVRTSDSPTFSSIYTNDWIRMNTINGLLCPGTNNAQLYANNGSYGPWKIEGFRNTYGGIEVGGLSNGNISWMVNQSSNVTGFHNHTYGWQFYWDNGVLYVGKNSYGGNNATVLDSSNYTGYVPTVGSGNTWTNINYFLTNNGGQSVNNSNSAKLQAYSTGNNSAFMSFHKAGHFAINMGLDDDNVFRIGGWSAGVNRLQLDMSGNLTMAGDVTAYSDARVKTNIKTIENALNKVLNLRGVSYNRTDSEDRKTKIGVIAQETLPIVPEVVNQDNNGMYNVSYGNFGGLFIEAFKEQQKQIEELKNKLDLLTNNK